MHSKESERAPSRSSSRILAAALALLAVAILLLVLSVLQNRRALPFQSRNAFALDGGESVAYAAAGNGLAAATTEHIQLFSARGKCVAREGVALAEPRCAGCSLVGIYYDAFQRGFTALYPDGSSRRTDTDGPVIFADVNENGVVTVLLEKSGYKGCVMVYDVDLTPLFRWDAGSGYPVAARVSADDRLCVSCVSEEGSTLRFFRIDREAEQAAYRIPDEVVLDLGFLSDGTVAAVTEERLVLLRSDGTLAAEKPFESRHLSAWWLRGRFAAVATVTGLDGGSMELSTFDSGGQLLGSRTAPRDIQSLSGAGDRLLVLYAGKESTLYTSALEEEISYQPPEDTTRIFLSADGRALFCGVGRAVLIDFDR